MTRNSEMGIHFFMQECNKNGELITTSPTYDLEGDFSGLMYGEARGLLDLGKVKNTYEETYADSNKLRVYMPARANIKREATTVTFTFYFTGENRSAVFTEFCEYATSGFRAYWDTARKKRLIFYTKEGCAVSEELYHGSTPYIKLELTVQNIFGNTFDVIE